MKNCCEINANSKYSQCIRKSDKKIFKLPRKYSRKKCEEGIRGFTMRSSCAPWKDCIKKGGKMKINRKLPIMKNINNGNLKVCSNNPMTGFYRDGYCRTGYDDTGTHTVCAEMDQEFLNFTKKQGNDLSSVVKPGQRWCLCEYRWDEAYKNNVAPKVILEATNKRTKKNITNNIFKSKRFY